MTCLLLAQDTQVKIVCVSDLLVIIAQSFPTLAEVTEATKSFEGPRDCDPWDALLLVHNMFEIDQNSNIWGPFPLPIIDIDKKDDKRKKTHNS